MYGSKYFRVRRGAEAMRGVGDLTITGTNQPIGEFYDYDSTDKTLGALANGRAAGFLSMGVYSAAMTYEQRELDYLPDFGKSGEKFTLQNVPIDGEIEVECALAKAYNATQNMTTPVLLVTTGTGALSASTAQGTLCSYKNGRIYVAQSGDHAEWEVIDAARTPLVADANIRIVFRRVQGANIP